MQDSKIAVQIGVARVVFAIFEAWVRFPMGSQAMANDAAPSPQL